jgi:NAD(P)-dependent dehydrogenase (short-subunit alcohol dehydrogenase family)
MSLRNKVVVVTGAAAGLGFAYAQDLARHGVAVVLTDIKDASPDVLRLTASNERTRFCRADICSPSDMHQVIDRVLMDFAHIDVLINNAALYTSLPRVAFETLCVDDWERVLSANVIGTFVCTAAVTATMKARGRGKIINVASNVVHKGMPGMLHYVASKGAIIAMTRALARELGPFGITVNAVAPGYVLHDATAKTDCGRNDAAVLKRCLSRTQTPDDLLGSIRFLCSSDSDFITGQTIVVDGGEVFS